MMAPSRGGCVLRTPGGTVQQATAGESRYDPHVTADKLRAEVLALPAEERAEIAHALLESLHEHADPDAEAAWIAELDRRAQAVADGTAKLVSWDDARERIAGRLKASREGRTPPR